MATLDSWATETNCVLLCFLCLTKKECGNLQLFFLAKKKQLLTDTRRTKVYKSECQKTKQNHFQAFFAEVHFGKSPRSDSCLALLQIAVNLLSDRTSRWSCSSLDLTTKSLSLAVALSIPLTYSKCCNETNNDNVGPHLPPAGTVIRINVRLGVSSVLQAVWVFMTFAQIFLRHKIVKPSKLLHSILSMLSYESQKLITYFCDWASIVLLHFIAMPICRRA